MIAIKKQGTGHTVLGIYRRKKMRYRDAKKLHNGDQVILKRTDVNEEEVCIVQNIEVSDKIVIIWAMTSKYGFCGLPHSEYR